MGTISSALLKIKKSREYLEFTDAVYILHRKTENEISQETSRVIEIAKVQLEQKIKEMVRPIYNKVKGFCFQHNYNSKFHRISFLKSEKEFFDGLEGAIKKHLPEYYPFYEEKIIGRMEETIFEDSLKV